MAPPNHGSALLRISSATRDLRFRPRAERIAITVLEKCRRTLRLGVRVGGLCWVSVLGIAMLLKLQPLTPHMTVLVLEDVAIWLVVAGIAAPVLGGVAQLGGAVLRAPLALAQHRRLQGARDGDKGSVSLRGRVVALRTLRSPSDQDVVAFRARFTRAGRGPEIERAEPFWLDDGQPDPVLVEVEHLHLADPFPAFATGALHPPVEVLDDLPSIDAPTTAHEIVLRPGDEVEVTGWLSSEVDPSASAHFRSVPLRRILRGLPTSPLAVRQRSAPLLSGH